MSISYELAKRLKEAGLKTRSSDVVVSEDHCEQCDDYHHAYVPTLEELIEACGEDIHGVRRDGDGWSAYSMLTYDGRFDPDITIYGHGSTPLEAVCMLWLALNESKSSLGK